MTDKITMIELFSGIGAQERAFCQLGIDYEVINTCDCDKDAVLSYVAMRCDFEKELVKYEFPTQDKMIKELQAKNLGYDFKNNKHTITNRTPIKKLKQYYLADKLSKNLGDISKVEKLPYADIIVHSSPCQSFSCAGKGAGGDEGSGTTSSLMWESLRLIATSKPKYILWENVANVLSDKHKHNFIKYLEKLTELGYESSFDLLNSKNYEIPQNRLRIFCVSRRSDSNDNSIENIDDMPKSLNKQVEKLMKKIENNPNIKIWKGFTFPEQIPLTIRLKDIIEKNVDEKYYLPDERVEKILNPSTTMEPNTCLIQPKDRNYKEKNLPREVHIESKNDGISHALRTNGETMVVEPQVLRAERTEYGKVIRKQYEAGEIYEKIGNMREMRPRTDGVVNTITTLLKDNYVAEPIVENQRESNMNPELVGGAGSGGKELKVLLNEDIKWRVRKLTTKESWRLMGFTDADHDRAGKYVPASQLYKQAGNSIVTNVLVALFSSLFIKDGYKADVWIQYKINYKD